VQTQNTFRLLADLPQTAQPSELIKRAVRMRCRFLDDGPTQGKMVKKSFNNHGGGVRFIWNAMVKYIRKLPDNLRHKGFTENVLKKFVSKGEYTGLPEERKRKRDDIMQANAQAGLVVPNIFASAPWLEELNAQVRQQVVRDLKKANKAGLAKQLAQRARGVRPKKFTIGRKQKGSPSSWTFCLPAQAIQAIHVPRPTAKNNEDGQHLRTWTKLTLPANFSGFGVTRGKGRVPGVVYLTGKAPLDGGGRLLGDVRFTRDQLGRWSAVVQRVVLKPKMRRPLNERKCVFLDPGSRAGNTYYSPDTAETGAYLEKEGGSARLMALCLKLDASISERQAQPRRRDHKRFENESVKREHRIRARVKNLVNDAHKRMAKDLTNRFDTIVVPIFETQRMVRRPLHPKDPLRKINNKTARMLMTLSHYKFRQYLAHRCAVDGAEFVLCTEEYTTKACPFDGLLMDVGSSKTFTCSHCHFTADRDEKAAFCLAVKYSKV
jgi:transposase